MNKGIRGLRSVAILAAIALSASLVACSNASFTTNKLGNRSQNDINSNPNGIPFSNTDDGTITCHVELSKLSDCFTSLGVDGVNVTVVMDTSSSFLDREEVGRQLSRNFDNGLRNNLPLTITVVAANTDRSPHSSFGPGIFYRHGNEPRVIEVNSSSDLAAAKNALESKIVFNMHADPRSANCDSCPDNNQHWGANEMGLLNILNVMSRVGLGQQTNRPNYGQLIVFASDENDPCVPEPGVVAPLNEQEMYRNECFFGGQRINPTMVYRNMKTYANGRPLMVSGILNDHGRIVLGDPKNSGAGHGYLEVIQMANGTVAPIAASQSQSFFNF